MVWLIESTFQFSGQSNFLNERAPLGTQKPPSKAVKRPNCSHKAKNGGRRQLERREIASSFGWELTQILQRSVVVVNVYVYFHPCVGGCSFDLLHSHPSYSATRTTPLLSYSLDLWGCRVDPSSNSSMHGRTWSILPVPFATMIGLAWGNVLSLCHNEWSSLRKCPVTPYWSRSNKLNQKRYVIWVGSMKANLRFWELRLFKSGFMDTTMEEGQWGQHREQQGERRKLPSLNGIVWVPTSSLPMAREPPEFHLGLPIHSILYPGCLVYTMSLLPALTVVTLYYPLLLEELTICLHPC